LRWRPRVSLTLVLAVAMAVAVVAGALATRGGPSGSPCVTRVVASAAPQAAHPVSRCSR
jgi:hypothetical protein